MSTVNRFLRHGEDYLRQSRWILGYKIAAGAWLSQSKKFGLIALISTASFLFWQTEKLLAEDYSYHDTELSSDEEAKLDAFLLNMDGQLQKKQQASKLQSHSLDIRTEKPTTEAFGTLNFLGGLGGDNVTPPVFGDDPNNPFPSDPSDLPTDWGDGSFPFPVFQAKNGASERVAMEVLYQTFMYYGVFHVVEKIGSRVDFKVVKSVNGYFSSVTKLDVAYAIREFGRFLTAHLCGEPTMQNFYRVFAQVPAEEIGLRFKYDMAWALMGNSLPKDPTDMYKAGAKWSTFQQILTTSQTVQQSPTAQSKDFRTWITSLGDIMNVLQRLNKLMCYVDVRPDPKDELKKRIVVHKFLEMEKELKAHYDEMKQYIDDSDKAEKAAQLAALRLPPIDPLNPANNKK